MSRNKTGVWTKCEWCGKDIYKTQYQFNRHKHHYCSNECQAKAKHHEVYEDRVCEICGQLMHVRKKSTQKFCSTECQRIWQTRQVGFLNKRCTKKIINCDYCGEDFLIKQYKAISNTYHFCSKECRQKWYAEVWSQSEEWKEKNRKRAAQMISDKKKNTQTKPQIIVNDLLNKLNIIYTNEEQFIYYSVDNYLKDFNLIIEVMGDYWHGSPLKYKELNDMQRKNVGRDKAKHSFLLHKYGIEVLYLWEKDIYNNEQLCKELILLYIRNNGVLNNYHSFNYDIINGLLVEKENKIYAHQDVQNNNLENAI